MLIRWAFALICLLSFPTGRFGASEVAQNPSVAIRAYTVSRNQTQITLGDIAEFKNVDPDLLSQMSKVKMSKGPKSGERIEFSGEALSNILRTKSLARLIDENRISLAIPKRVVIEDPGFQVTELEVRAQITEHYARICECIVEITDLSMPQIKNKVEPAQWRLLLRGEPARGSFNIPLEVTAKTGERRSYWVGGRLTLRQEAPVARRLLSVGERVQPGDIEFKSSDTTYLTDDLPQRDEIFGRRVRRAIPINQIVGASALEREKALLRGDLVKVTHEEGQFQVMMTGLAEQDAYIGDTIRIKNSKSQQVISALVTGKGEATIK